MNHQPITKKNTGFDLKYLGICEYAYINCAIDSSCFISEYHDGYSCRVERKQMFGKRKK